MRESIRTHEVEGKRRGRRRRSKVRRWGRKRRRSGRWRSKRRLRRGVGVG